MPERDAPIQKGSRPVVSRLRVLVGVLLGTLLSAQSSAGRELSLGVSGQTIYDDNIFSSSIEKQDDVYFRIAPRIRAQERRGEFQWLFEYTPSYNYYATIRDLDGFDHDVAGQFSWRISPKTELTLSDRFRRVGFETRFNETTDVSVGDDPVVTRAFQRARVVSNFAQVGVTHRFGRRRTASITAFHQIYDRRSEEADTEGYGLSAQYFYIWNERTQLGPQLVWNRRIQKPFVGQDIETDFVNLSARVVYEIAPGFTVNFSAGPALVISDETALPNSRTTARIPGGGGLIDVTTCPTLDDGTPYLGGGCEALDLFANAAIETDGASFPGTTPALSPLLGEGALLAEAASLGEVTLPFADSVSTGGTELTFFADATLRKQWKNWTFNLGYRRSDDSTASNFGVTAVTDRVFGSLLWRATEKLQLTLGASYLKRDQEQDLVFQVTGLSNSSLVIDSRLGVPTLIGRRITFMNVAEATSLRALEFASDFQTENSDIALSGRYQLRRNLFMTARAAYREQKQSGRLVAASTIDQFILSLGFDYSFEPWRF